MQLKQQLHVISVSKCLLLFSQIQAGFNLSFQRSCDQNHADTEGASGKILIGKIGPGKGGKQIVRGMKRPA